ncbi:MAG: hypothetical protein ABJN69_08020 [Hellea sp.]
MTKDKSVAYFTLEPLGGWGRFARNAELADLIYDSCLEHVNKGRWAYINPMSGMGIFEDETGNYLCLETLDIEDTNIITDMHFGLNEAMKSDMKTYINQWEIDFGLLRTVKP